MTSIYANYGKVVPDSNIGIPVALGMFPGYTAVDKFGRNPDGDTATTPEDIWFGGGEYTGHPTGAPETVEVFSADATDTAAGTGARTIRIVGLKTSDDTEYSSEDITLNGVTAVESVNTWYRVNRALVLTAGSGGTNAGTITIRHTTTTANVFAQMPAGFGQTNIAALTVPAEHVLVIQQLKVMITRANGSAGSATVALAVRDFGTGAWRYLRVEEMQTGGPAGDSGFEVPLVIDAKADVKMRVVGISDNNTVISAEIFGYYVSDIVR